jgi:hypothetical protein
MTIFSPHETVNEGLLWNLEYTRRVNLIKVSRLTILKVTVESTQLDMLRRLCIFKLLVQLCVDNCMLNLETRTSSFPAKRHNCPNPFLVQYIKINFISVYKKRICNVLPWKCKCKMIIYQVMIVCLSLDTRFVSEVMLMKRNGAIPVSSAWHKSQYYRPSTDLINYDSIFKRKTSWTTLSIKAWYKIKLFINLVPC